MPGPACQLVALPRNWRSARRSDRGDFGGFPRGADSTQHKADITAQSTGSDVPTLISPGKEAAMGQEAVVRATGRLIG